MFKVGDYVKLINDTPQKRREHGMPKNGVMRIETITACKWQGESDTDDTCKDCVGYINGMCWQNGSHLIEKANPNVWRGNVKV